MQVTCRSCLEIITADNLNLDRMVAKCSACHAVFPIDIPGADDEPGPRPRVARPAAIRIEQTESGEGGAFDGFVYRSNARPRQRRLELSWRWWTRSTWFLAAFAVFWNGFLVVWYTVALSVGDSLMMILIPLLHVAVGVVLAYYVAVQWFNRSRLVVDENGVGIDHGPLPWPRAERRVPRRAIDQCFCEEYTSHTENDRPVRAYKVKVRTVDGDKVELVRALDHPDKAIYIEHMIEQALSIQDRPVHGELPR